MSKLNLLDNLIQNDSIRIKQEAKDWKEAIKISCEPLIEAKIINEKYIDAIIKSTEEHGPYYLITEGMGMPHASATNDCVFSNGFSLVTFKEPIKFMDDPREVKLLMTLAAIDGETHTAVAIPQIIAVFEDPSNVEKMCQMDSKEEIIEFIKSIDYTKYLF